MAQVRDRAVIAAAIGISIVGGSLGAIGMWFVFSQLPQATAVASVALGLTVIGWTASAYLSEQAQRRMFRHNLVNTARLEIVKSMRETQAWLGRLETFSIVTRLHWEEKGHIQKSDVGRLSILLAESPAAETIMRLEEYELLFPPTRHVREQLQNAMIDLRLEHFDKVISELASGDAARIEAGTKAMTESPAGSISACLEDLLIWTQNFALSQFTGRKVPERQPMDPTAVPRVVLRSDSMLEIVENGKPWPVRTFKPDPSH